MVDAGIPEFQVPAYSRLSEMFHDQSDDLAAAETLQELLGIELQQLQVILGRMEQTPEEIRAA